MTFPQAKIPLIQYGYLNPKLVLLEKSKKLNARIVAKDNEQAKGIDFLETFALVVC
jgi:hypothetical protein